MSSTFQLKVFVCHLLCVCVRSPCSWVPSFEWLHTAVSGYWSSVVACDVCSAYGKERMYFYMRVGRSELHHSESRPTNGALLGVFVSACVWVSAWASFSVLASLRSCVCVCVSVLAQVRLPPLCCSKMTVSLEVCRPASGDTAVRVPVILPAIKSY